MRLCKRGHEMTPENSYQPPGRSYSTCKRCAADRSMAYHRKRVATETPEQREERLAKRRVIGKRYTASHPDIYARRMEAMATDDLAAFRQQKREQYRRRKDADPDTFRARARDVMRRQLDTRRDEINARKRERYAADPERHRARSRDYARERPEQMRDKGLRRFYGMTLAEYEAMREAQGHRCAICGREETVTAWGKVRALSVDHDHETGAIRGLLCAKCNRGLGMFRDDPDVLDQAAEYLRDSRVNREVA